MKTVRKDKHQGLLAIAGTAIQLLAGYLLWLVFWGSGAPNDSAVRLIGALSIIVLAVGLGLLVVDVINELKNVLNGKSMFKGIVLSSKRSLFSFFVLESAALFLLAVIVAIIILLVRIVDELVSMPVNGLYKLFKPSAS